MSPLKIITNVDRASVSEPAHPRSAVKHADRSQATGCSACKRCGTELQCARAAKAAASAVNALGSPNLN